MNWIKKLPKMSTGEINNRILILKLQMPKLDDIQQQRAELEIAILQDELLKRDGEDPVAEYIKFITKKER